MFICGIVIFVCECCSAFVFMVYCVCFLLIWLLGFGGFGGWFLCICGFGFVMLVVFSVWMLMNVVCLRCDFVGVVVSLIFWCF